PQPLVAVRNIADRARANVSIPMSGASQLLRFSDPDTGEALMTATAALPAKGFVKPQSFVDFALLQSAHGVVIRPNSDDLQVEFAADKITSGRPGGLTLSAAETAPGRATAMVRPIFDTAVWKNDLSLNFSERRDALVMAAAMSSGDKRIASHVDLARFYLACG